MTDWMDDAHCRTRLWRTLDLDAQREVCDGCPVRTQCLEWGREVLAGLTATELRDLIHDAHPDLWGGRTPAEIVQDVVTTTNDVPTHFRASLLRAAAKTSERKVNR